MTLTSIIPYKVRVKQQEYTWEINNSRLGILQNKGVGVHHPLWRNGRTFKKSIKLIALVVVKFEQISATIQKHTYLHWIDNCKFHKEGTRLSFSLHVFCMMIATYNKDAKSLRRLQTLTSSKTVPTIKYSFSRYNTNETMNNIKS